MGGSKGPKKFKWMENIHGVLHDIKWIKFHGLLDIALGPSKRGGSDAKVGAAAIC